MIKLPTEYQYFIYVSRYSRWLEEENRLHENFLIENKEFEDIIKNYLK